MDSKLSARITPLWIIAAFVTLTEAILGYAVTQVSGGIQIALTAFVIAFALLVAGGFFIIRTFFILHLSIPHLIR